MKKVLLILLISTSCLGQKLSNIEIFQNDLSLKTKEDTARANVLIQLAKSYYMSNPAKTLEYSEQATRLSEKLKYGKGLADARRFGAIAYYSMGNFKKAEGELNLALKNYEGIKNNTGIMACLSMLGTVNTVQNNYPLALNYYQKVIRLGEKTKEDLTIGVTYTNMGVIYSEMKNYEMALKYFQEGLSFSTKINSQVGIAGGMANIGNVYFQTKQYEKALSYYREALTKNIEIDNKLGIAREYGNVGNAYMELKNHNEGYQNFQKALEINESIKNKKGTSVSLLGIGKYFQENKEYSKALNFFKKAIQLATEIKVIDVQKEGFDNLSTVYEKMGLMDSAFFSFKKYVELKESIDNENNRKQISRLELQYEFDTKEEKYKIAELISAQKLEQQKLMLTLNQFKLKESNNERDLARFNFLKTQAELKTEKFEKLAKEKQLALVAKENELNRKEIQISKISLEANKKQKWFLIIGIILFAIIGGLLFWQNKQRKNTNAKLLKLNSELDEANKIKARFFAILSHDLRSPVANLISFLNLQKEAPELVTKEIKERNDKKIIESAENLIETMESMLLWSKGQMQNFKPQKQEILIKDVFSYLQKFFENATEAQITFENPQNLSVISDIDFLKIIMQNLTLNATKALSGKPNAQIVWTVQKENNHILLSIKDNGPGLSQKQIDTLYLDQSTIGSKSGLGLHLIRDLTKAIDCTFKIAYTSDAGSEFQLIFG